jgi:hypothetical protein
MVIPGGGFHQVISKSIQGEQINIAGKKFFPPGADFDFVKGQVRRYF